MSILYAISIVYIAGEYDGPGFCTPIVYIGTGIIIFFHGGVVWGDLKNVPHCAQYIDYNM